MCACVWWDSNDHFDVRQAYVRLCEVHGACPPMQIWCDHNAHKIRKGHRWGHMYVIHRGWDCVLWFAAGIFWVYLDLQVPNATCKFNEEDQTGKNQTVFVLDGWVFFFRIMEASNMVRRWRLMIEKHTGTFTLVVLMSSSHLVIYLLDQFHMVQWMCVFLRKVVNCGRFVVLFGRKTA